MVSLCSALYVNRYNESKVIGLKTRNHHASRAMMAATAMADGEKQDHE